MNTKVESLLSVAKGQLGSPYVFGAWGNICTVNLRKRYAGYNPSHAANIYKKCQILSNKATTCNGCKYNGRLAFDCRGYTAWSLKQINIIIAGGGATSQYKNDSNWVKKGLIAEMPELPCVVFKNRDGRMQHTGLYVGNRKILHCINDVQWGNLNATWTHFAIPHGLYTPEEIELAYRYAFSFTDIRNETPVLEPVKPQQESKPTSIPKTIKMGSRGVEVEQLQRILRSAGYTNVAIDGIFGIITSGSVKSYQTSKGLVSDGIVGPKTWAELLKES